MKHVHFNFIIRAATCDFQQYDILTSVDSDGLVQPPFKAAQSITFDLLILKIMFLFFKNTVKILKFR